MLLRKNIYNVLTSLHTIETKVPTSLHTTGKKMYLRLYVRNGVNTWRSRAWSLHTGVGCQDLSSSSTLVLLQLQLQVMLALSYNSYVCSAIATNLASLLSLYFNTCT